MSAHDLWLLSPQVALVGLGLLVILADMVTSKPRPQVLVGLVVVGLAVMAGLTVALWSDVDASPGKALAGVFGTLQVDRLSIFFYLLIVAVTALVTLASYEYIQRLPRHQGEYFALIVLAATGMTLLASTTELLSIYISLELTSLPMVALAAFLSTPRSSEAGFKFLVLSGTSSAFLLYGIAMIYGFTGTTQLGGIASALATAGDAVPFAAPAVLVGAVFVASGFGFKVAAVPFQMWVPDVYQGAPTPVTAFLSVASKAAGFAVLLRIFYTAFPAFYLDWSAVFAGLAVLSMLVGNLVAIAQEDIKRMLGYSTIGHAGYLLVGLAAVARTGGETLGPSALLFYLVAYAATNLAAFFAIIAITNRTGGERIEDFAGLGRRAPLAGAVLALAMLSLIGIPPTGIFFGKLYLFTAAVGADMAWLAVLGLISSVISAYYYLRVVRVLYMAESKAATAITSGWTIGVAVGVTGIAVVLAGLVSGPVLDFAKSATSALVGG